MSNVALAECVADQSIPVTGTLCTSGSLVLHAAFVSGTSPGLWGWAEMHTVQLPGAKRPPETLAGMKKAFYWSYCLRSRCTTRAVTCGEDDQGADAALAYSFLLLSGIPAAGRAAFRRCSTIRSGLGVGSNNET
jgi:hypothetical protein